MILQNNVITTWNASNKIYYQSKGYSFTKMFNTILIDVKDLKENSNIKIRVKCSLCNKEKYIAFNNYNTCIKNTGFYHCDECSYKTTKNESLLNTKLQKSISFEQWCIENDRQDIFNRWDYELNKKQPSKVCYSSKLKYYFKCPNRIHKSELKNISAFTGGQEGSIRCNQCNSFAQWGIDNICSDFLEKYWDYKKNIISPWEISFGSKKIIWIKCQEKDYHGSYKIISKNFSIGQRCSYCSGNDIHIKDSLGILYPKILGIWSDKNKDTPYEYAPKSNKKIWFKCKDGNHEDYLRCINESNVYNFRCPNCVREREESFLQEKVRLHLESLKHTILHEHKCKIKCVNPKTKHVLPYDNEIVELKLIVEVHGVQHYKTQNIFNYKKSNHNNTTLEYELHYQQLKDRYKRIFAKRQGYFYLEIPYWTDDKEETWKDLIINKIKEISNI